MFRLRVALAFAITVAAPAAAPDWTAAKNEAVEILADLVRLDTAQPDGNETVAARYIQQKLAAEGIDSELLGPTPERSSIVARIKGRGGARPLLLLGHLDVVAVERDEWSFDPFGGEIKDGVIYGRGTGDDKGVVSGSLTAFLLLKRLGVPLDRDVIFLGVADEEAGGVQGITWLLENRRDAIDAELAINEGGSGVFNRELKLTRFEIQTAEKTPRRADLKAKGTSGHGSIPLEDNPVGTLARALARLFDYEAPARLNETTREYFRRLAEHAPEQEAEVYRKIVSGDLSEQTQAELRGLSPMYYSMIRTSIVPTIMQGGYLKNVIPSEAQATVDIRALPDVDPEELFPRLKKIMNEPNVDLIPHPVTRPGHDPAPLDSPVFLAFEKVLAEMYPEALVLPRMSTGATDSAQLRAAGIAAYGFGPGKPEWDLAGGIHGKDEYLYVEPFKQYVEILYRVVVATAGSK